MNQAGALVHVYADGSIALNHGGTEMGQGLNVKVAQVVAEEFQVDIGRVKITATTTAKVPNTSPTAASSGSDLNGMAARNAAAAIKARLVRFLAERHQADPAEVRFLPNRIRIGEHEISFDQAIGEAYRARVHLSAAGFYATPRIQWDRPSGKGRPFFYFAYGAAVSEVAIDTLTGENRILRADILHDVGRSLNPAIDLGQIEGGYLQGAGWLTMEELVWNEQGRLMTHAPSTYKIPACSDRPIDLRMALWSKGRNAEETIYRSKAVGEPPLMLGISVLMALSDAVASVGGYRVYPALDAPATPERILMAVERVKRQAGRLGPIGGGVRRHVLARRHRGGHRPARRRRARDRGARGRLHAEGGGRGDVRERGGRAGHHRRRRAGAGGDRPCAGVAGSMVAWRPLSPPPSGHPQARASHRGPEGDGERDGVRGSQRCSNLSTAGLHAAEASAPSQTPLAERVSLVARPSP